MTHGSGSRTTPWSIAIRLGPGADGAEGRLGCRSPESIVLALEAAAQDRATGALLLGQTGRPIHRSTLDNIVHHMGVEAGISRRVTSLLLPASCLTNALDSGASLAKVQHLARHAQPQTTMRYDRNRTNLYDHAIHSLVSYLTPRDEDEDRMET